MQIWFHDLLTQAADAKDKAGSLFSMFRIRSSFIDAKLVIGVLGSFGFSSIFVSILQLLLKIYRFFFSLQTTCHLNLIKRQLFLSFCQGVVLCVSLHVGGILLFFSIYFTPSKMIIFSNRIYIYIYK